MRLAMWRERPGSTRSITIFTLCPGCSGSRLLLYLRRAQAVSQTQTTVEMRALERVVGGRADVDAALRFAEEAFVDCRARIQLVRHPQQPFVADILQIARVRACDISS